MTELNIIDAIGRRIVLEKRAGYYWGVCPFHKQEKKVLMHESMIVDRESKTYRCLECKVEGDAEDFLKRYEGIDEETC